MSNTLSPHLSLLDEMLDEMSADSEVRSAVTAVILAGGRGRRMGGEDKGLLAVAGRPMVEHVLCAVRPQVAAVILSANRNRERYATLGHPVVADAVGDFWGPLAGVASAMQVAGTPYLLTVPCDAPLVPSDLAERLYRAVRGEGAEIGVVHDGVRMQQAFALLSCGLLADLLAYLDAGGRKVEAWLARHRLAMADFSGRAEAFANLNTPGELAALESRLGAEGG
jgi:molybdopterin-guanine dinucleotide biosynthesis protein A